MDVDILKRTLLILALVAAVTVTGVLLAHREPRQWTSDSDAALAEFQRGLEDAQRMYYDEAGDHFAHAAELDPDFLVAKQMALQAGAYGEEGDQRIEEFEKEFGTADLSRLTDRERLLIEYHSARRRDQPERAESLLAEYLERHPDDPFVLFYRCQMQWREREFTAAEGCYRRMIENDPNWVIAQNQLGYLAMAQGEWQRAEEQFETYRYLAPDQANPHDSLGELLLLTGRFDEARQELREALAVKPDFCASWKNLVTLALLEDRWDEAERTIDRTRSEELCPASFADLQRCRLGVWRAFRESDWPGAVNAYLRPECEHPSGDAAIMAYEAALRAGLEDEAAGLRAEIEKRLAERSGEQDPTWIEAHLDGIRLYLDGRPEAAVERLRQADAQLAFWNADGGYMKLTNQLALWRALTDAGQAEEAERVLAELRAVNPVIAERWASGTGS